MTVSWPHAQQMFHPTGLKQKVKLKKLLESFALPSGHVDKEIAHHSFFDFQHLCSWRRWKPWRDISLYNSVRTRQWKAVDRCALLWILSWNWIVMNHSWKDWTKTKSLSLTVFNNPCLSLCNSMWMWRCMASASRVHLYHHFYSRQNVGKMLNCGCLVGFLGSLCQNAK